MARREEATPDFVEALARGLDVLRSFHAGQPELTLSELAAATGLARPTVRRILITLQALGYVTSSGRAFSLTPRVLDLGMAYVCSQGLWDLAEPHLRELVAQTHESSSMAQLDGADIVYVARIAVPKIVTLAATIGTRFPARVTAQGKVLLAALSPERLAASLAEPSRSAVVARRPLDRQALDRTLAEVRARGWALADEELAPGIRSIAAPLRDGAGRVIAAMNVTVHAAETSIQTLVDEHLPVLLRAANAISADWAAAHRVPHLCEDLPRL